MSFRVVSLSKQKQKDMKNKVSFSDIATVIAFIGMIVIMVITILSGIDRKVGYYRTSEPLEITNK